MLRFLIAPLTATLSPHFSLSKGGQCCGSRFAADRRIPQHPSAEYEVFLL